MCFDYPRIFIVHDHETLEQAEAGLLWLCNEFGGENKWEVEIRPFKAKRSILQNRLYWEYMTQLGEHTGHTKDEMSLFFKWKFLGADRSEVYGQAFNAVKSTTDLNTKEFTEYLRNIEVFASEQGFTFKAPAYYEEAMR